MRAYHRILRALSEGVVISDARGRIVEANEAAFRLLGPPPADHSAAHWVEAAGLAEAGGTVRCGEERNPVLRALSGRTVAEEEWIASPRGDARGSVLLVGARPLASDGRPAGTVLVLRDVTARTTATVAAGRLSSAVEQTADAVMITDLAGRILYVNPGFTQITGYAGGYVLGRTPRVLCSGRHPPEYFADLWRTILRGAVYRGTITNRRQDGTTYDAEQTITPMRDSSGAITSFVSVSKDMTVRNLARDLELQMRVAEEVQEHFHRRRPPKVPGLDVAGASFAASRTCGDYWDVLRRPSGTVALVVGDVAGHGFGAALLMAEVRAYVRALAAGSLSPGDLLTEVDRQVSLDLPPGIFITMLLVEIDPAAGTIRYCDAGHPAALILSAQGELRARLPTTGPPIGLTERRRIDTRDAPALAPSDLVLLASDGATDHLGRNGEPASDEDLLRLVRPLLGRPSADIVTGLRDAILVASDGRAHEDDVTLLVGVWSPTATSAA